MELLCDVCGRANKIEYRSSDEKLKKKETIVECAYCGVEILRVNDYREAYSIEWNDEYYT
ncbi:hypothetical protein [Clostridium celatum]|uniref:hypothetical protein n=1 Tax=Clostridium celatum TaxID=36834 RepID=UPI00319E9D32